MKIFVRAAWAALAVCGAASATPIFNPATGHYYEIVQHTGNNPEMNWTAAGNAAVALGGHLVTINDALEESWLVDMFGVGQFWIGLNDKASEGSWEWVSGEPVTFTNWAPGEPNNQGNEDFAVLSWSGTKWNDLPNNSQRLGIAEIALLAQTNGVPEPASLALLGLGLAGMGWARRAKG